MVFKQNPCATIFLLTPALLPCLLTAFIFGSVLATFLCCEKRYLTWPLKETKVCFGSYSEYVVHHGEKVLCFFIGIVGCVGPQGWREQKQGTVFQQCGYDRDSSLGYGFSESAQIYSRVKGTSGIGKPEDKF